MQGQGILLADLSGAVTGLSSKVYGASRSGWERAVSAARSTGGKETGESAQAQGPSLGEQLEGLGPAARGAAKSSSLAAAHVATLPGASAHLQAAAALLQEQMERAAARQEQVLRGMLLNSDLEAISERKEEPSLSNLCHLTSLTDELSSLKRQQGEATQDLFSSMARMQQEFFESMSAAWAEASRLALHEEACEDHADPLDGYESSQAMWEPAPLWDPLERVWDEQAHSMDSGVRTTADIEECGQSVCSESAASHSTRIPTSCQGEPPRMPDLLDFFDGEGAESDMTRSDTASSIIAREPEESSAGVTTPPQAGTCSHQGQEEEQGLEARVEQWREGKGIHALLASLHEMAPAGMWTERQLGDLLDPKRLRSAYRAALLAFHPDKVPREHSMLGQLVVNALVSAFKSQ